MKTENFKNIKNFDKIKKKISTYYLVGTTKYHKFFRLPLTGTRWEEVLEGIFVKSNINILTPVNSSHRRGVDIEVDYFGGISCKTAKKHFKVRKNVWACKISSYRLGSSTDYLGTIRELNSAFSYYFLSLYYEKDGYYIYSLYVIPTDRLMDTNRFTFDGEVSDIIDGVQLQVKGSMSEQLWVEIFDLAGYAKYKWAESKVKVPLSIGLLD